PPSVSAADVTRLSAGCRRTVAGLVEICRSVTPPIADQTCAPFDEEAMTTILVVEDELDLGRLVVRELESSGYHVRHAPDGPTALRLFAEQPPDLVVLDWMLPGVDGLEVLRRLRQSSPVPVLMLTARAEEVDRVVGLEVGADDYLTKP